MSFTKSVTVAAERAPSRTRSVRRVRFAATQRSRWRHQLTTSVSTRRSSDRGVSAGVVLPVVVEECFDLVVSRAFDRVVVVIIDVVAETDVHVVESIVVVGVVVADVRAGGKRSAFVDAEGLGATDSPTANNGGLRCGAGAVVSTPT